MSLFRRPAKETTTYSGQEYNRYPRSKYASQRRYFRRYLPEGKGVVMLHRQMWVDAHGAIPSGHQVHHKNHRYNDNVLGNLELVEFVTHRTQHPEHVDRIRRYAGRGTLGVRIRRRLKGLRRRVSG